MMNKKIVGALVGAAMASGAAGASADNADRTNMLLMDLEWGQVVIRMMPEVAPQHVERIQTLTREGFYDGVLFHRVIEGFMAQTGDPTGTGSGGSELPDLPAEFSDRRHLRGTVSMARTSNPNSANSQFFIVFAPSSWLDGQYTVWGQVVSGMEHVDRIKRGPQPSGVVPVPADRIVRMRLASDVPDAELPAAQ